jgi:hypothetical protein
VQGGIEIELPSTLQGGQNCAKISGNDQSSALICYVRPKFIRRAF